MALDVSMSAIANYKRLDSRGSNLIQKVKGATRWRSITWRNCNENPEKCGARVEQSGARSDKRPWTMATKRGGGEASAGGFAVGVPTKQVKLKNCKYPALSLLCAAGVLVFPRALLCATDRCG